MRPSTVVRMTEIAPLADRVAKVLTDGRDHGSAAIDLLLDEVDGVISETSSALQNASSRALDPRLDAIAALAAREEARRLEFDLARLSASEQALRPLLESAQRREEAARVAEHRGRIVSQRDALAAELSEAYPRLSRELTDLLTRIEACNALTDSIAAEPVECVARGVPAHFRDAGGFVPKLLDDVALPSFRCSEPRYRFQWSGRISREQRAPA